MSLSQKAMAAAGLKTPAARAQVARRQTRFCYTSGPVFFLGQQVVAAMQRIGWDAKIFEFERSPAKQEAAFARGASKARAWQSPHQYGLAVDIIHRTRGWPPFKDRFWADLNATVRAVGTKYKCNLTHGYDWGWDAAHIELKEWKDWASLWGPVSPTPAIYAQAFQVVLPQVYAANRLAIGEAASFRLAVNDGLSFPQAFRKARLAGLAEFEWRGRRYNTELA